MFISANLRSNATAPYLGKFVRKRSDGRSAVHHCDVMPESRQRMRRQFPIREMRAKHKRRWALAAQRAAALQTLRVHDDAAVLGIGRIEPPQLIEMGIFCQCPPKIVPHAE